MIAKIFRPWGLGRLCAAIIVLLPSFALAQDSAENGSRIDPRAVEIVTRAAEFLSDQSRISFTWFNSFDVVIDGREKITHMMSGVSVLARDEGFYSTLDYDGDQREFFFDGGMFYINDINENAYAELPFAGSFEELVVALSDEYDITMPMWEILSRDGHEAVLDRIEAAAYLGEISMSGTPVHHLAFSEYEYDWQIWISTDDEKPVIHAIVGTEPHVQGWPQFRAYLYDWDFLSFPEEGAFSFVPSEDAIKMTLPKAGEESAVAADAAGNGG